MAVNAQDEGEMIDQLRALSEPRRLSILQFMTQGEASSCCDRICSDENGYCASDLVEMAGVSQPTVSHHLKTLEEAGLVKREKRGTWMCFFPRVDEIERFLDRLSSSLLPGLSQSKEVKNRD